MRPASGRSGSTAGINLDPCKSVRLNLPQFRGRVGEKYVLTAPDVFGSQVRLNGGGLSLGPQGEIPTLAGVELGSEETITLPPLAYGFFIFRQ